MGAASSKAEDALDLSADVGCAAARTKLEKKSKELGKDISRATNFVLGGPPPDELPASLSSAPENPKNNILLMTDGYKFSHHKQYPVSWMPEHGRPKEDGIPPVLFPCSGQSIQDPQGVRVLRLAPVPGVGVLKLTIVTSVSTAVVAVEPVPEETEPDFIFSGSPKTYTGALKDEIIMELFRAMNTPFEKREAAKIARWASELPYVNGGLFAGSLEAPKFTRIARSYLIHIGGLDWKKINPDIFGSMIQAVADDDERGELGMHYTSVPNILKVLNPLFLDDLREQLESAGDNGRKLLNLRNRLAKIRVFDPACGSGNTKVEPGRVGGR